MSIYSELILDHYQHPNNFGGLKKYSKKTIINNPLCGDRIEMFIVFDNDKIKDIKFLSKACAISTASASMLTEIVKGKTKHELKKIDRKFIIKMLGFELGVNRIKCAMLPVEALKKLI